jgi:hypothetical protein
MPTVRCQQLNWPADALSLPAEINRPSKLPRLPVVLALLPSQAADRAGQPGRFTAISPFVLGEPRPPLKPGFCQTPERFPLTR